jgi:zinc/manganese transport system ATP-binding protein
VPALLLAVVAASVVALVATTLSTQAVAATRHARAGVTHSKVKPDAHWSRSVRAKHALARVKKTFAPETPLRARDLVGLGLDGHRWGIRLNARKHRRRVDELLEMVGAEGYAEAPVGQLSGGEQQRLRAAQALASDPQVLLCDEPLLSLDLHHQQAVSAMINRQCHEKNSALVFVTHEINPIIDYVDRVLYLAGGQFRVGTPEEVMTTEVLSRMYNSHVEVIHNQGRIVVVGLPDATTHQHGEGE